MSTENVDIVVTQAGANEAAAGYTNIAQAADVAATATEKVAGSMDKSSASSTRSAETAGEVADSHKRAGGAADEHGHAQEALATKTELTNTIFEKFKQTLELLGIGLAAHELLEYAEAFENTQRSLLQVITGTHELEEATQHLFDIANSTRSSFEGTVGLYTSLKQATRDLKTSDDDLYQVTTILNEAVVSSGKDFETSSGVMKQFALALSTGQVEGRGLHQLLLQFPQLARQIADNFYQGSGVTVGSLKNMAAQGQITSKELIEAVIRSGAAVESTFNRMPVTIGQAFTILHNNIIKFIGDANEQNGALGKIASSIIFVAFHLGSLVTGIEVATAAFVTFRVALAFQEIATLGTALGSASLLARVLAVAVSLVIAPLTTARLAFAALNATMLANPVAVVVVALGAAATAFVLFGDSIKLSADGSMTVWTVFMTVVSGVVKTVSQVVVGLYKTIAGVFASINQALGGSGVVWDIFRDVMIGVGIYIVASLIPAFVALLIPVAGFTLGLVAGAAAATAAYLAVIALRDGMDAAKKEALRLADAVQSGLNSSLDALKHNFDFAGDGAQHMADKLKKATDDAGGGLLDLSKKAKTVGGEFDGDFAGAHAAIANPVAAGVAEAEAKIAELEAAMARAASESSNLASSGGPQGMSHGPVGGGGNGGIPTELGQGGSTGTTAGNAYSEFVTPDMQAWDAKYGPGYGALAQAAYEMSAFGTVHPYANKGAAENWLHIAEAAGVTPAAAKAKGISLPTLAGLDGFQMGGAFDVGGSGGPDSQLVQFMATPGERVSVQTPAQQRGGGGAGMRPINVNMSVITPDANSFGRSKTQILSKLSAGLAGVK